MAIRTGADWVGLNFVSGPRRIALQDGIAIASRLNDPSRAVALVLVRDDAMFDTELASLYRAGVRRLQLYGTVTEQSHRRIRGLGFETLYVRGVADEDDLGRIDQFILECGSFRPTYVLLDAAGATSTGGSGKLANWNAIASAQHTGRLADWPAILVAGGLTADNVGDAILKTQPFGVDVSSGVEISPGRKDPARIARFVEAVRVVASGA